MRCAVLLSLILLFLEIESQVVNLLIVNFHSSGIQEVIFLEDQIAECQAGTKCICSAVLW